MVENIERHLHMGKPPIQAPQTRPGSSSDRSRMTITLATVYTPIAHPGRAHRLSFREFAFTLAGAVIVSGIVALTLSR